MKNLRNSVILLFSFFSILFSIAQVERFEKNVLNFHAAFFIILIAATLIGISKPSQIKISFYAYLGVWAFVYVATWYFYLRLLTTQRTIQELSIQFLLIEISAGLSYNVGKYINQTTRLMSNMAGGAYPNRTLELETATDDINTEITRSRRYNRPLSVLVFQLNRNSDLPEGVIEGVQKDLLLHFASAKTGQIINEHARQTDLILRDHTHRFAVLCPETDHHASVTLGKRIYQAIAEKVDKGVTWSTASFPDESLTFDELIEKALRRLSAPQTEIILKQKETTDIV